MNQNRWKSYILWVAVASLMGMALVDLGLVASTTVFDQYVEKLLYIAVLVGVINNPKDGTKL